MDMPHVAHGYVIYAISCWFFAELFLEMLLDNFTNVGKFTVQSVILFVLFYYVFQPIFNSLSLVEFIIRKWLTPL